MYYLSIIFSIFSFVMNMYIYHSDPETELYFGYKELYICMGISFVFIALGLIFDKRKENELWTS